MKRTSRNFQLLRKTPPSAQSLPSLVVSSVGTHGKIQLNRPEALNAVNNDMINDISYALKDFESSKSIASVSIGSIHGKNASFCAGGDILAITNPIRSSKDYSVAERFFKDEYKLIESISSYSKPMISLMDGYALGGGVGLGVHCSHPVVTENTSFGLPQVTIGLFPDVGSAYTLSHLAHPGLGLYLALTGIKLNGSQCLEYGLASHYVSSNQMTLLDEKLGQIKPSLQLGSLEVSRILGELSKNSTPKKKWNIDLYKIEKFFHGKQNAAEIFDHLENEIFRATSGEMNPRNVEWEINTLQQLERSCPMSIAIAFEHVTNAKKKSLNEVLKSDFKISQWCMRNDFAEGVRSLLVDRDGKPKWSNSNVHNVDFELVREIVN